MPASIFNGSAVKILKDILRFKTGKEMLSLSSDPEAVATLAPQGSIGLYGATLYVKQDAGSTTNWINFKASDSPLAFLTGATYTTIQEMHNVLNSVGLISGNGVTDGGAGTVDVGAGTALIRATDSDVAELLFFDFGSATGLALTDSNVNYIYVEYNAGTPQIIATTSKRSDTNTNILLGVVSREGTEVHISDNTEIKVSNHASLVVQRLLDTAPFATVIGDAPLLGETGTRNLSVEAASFWEGLSTFSTAAFDSSGADTFEGYFYRDGGGGWTKVTAQSQIDNTQYDDGDGGLATLTAANKYGVHWVYIEQDGDVSIVYGRGDYFIGAALDASPPADIPPQLQVHGKLIGKVIIQKNAAVFTLLESLTEGGDFQAFVPTDHNQLINLQGGNGSDELYHLTLKENGKIDKISLDTFYTQDHEEDGIDNYTTGNNAAFDGGGVLDGALSLDTGSLINDVNCLKYVMGASSANDYIASEVIVVGEKHQDNTNGFELYFKYDGDDDDIRYVIWDDTNNVELTADSEFFKSASGAKRFSAQAYVPDGVTAIKHGIFVVTGNSGKILLLDDITGTSSPYVAKETQLIQEYTLQQASNAVTNGVSELEFNLGAATITNVGSGLIVADPDPGNTRTKFIAQQKCAVSGSFTAPCPANQGVLVTKGGVEYQMGTTNSGSTQYKTVSIDMELEAGEYFTVSMASTSGVIGGTISPVAAKSHLSFIATAQTEQIIAYNSRSASNLVIKGEGNGGTSITADVTNIDFTEVSDVGFGGANFDGTSIAIPSDGQYTVDTSVLFTASLAGELELYIDGTLDRPISPNVTNARHKGSYTDEFTKGQVLTIRSSVSGTLSNDTTNHYLTVTKIGVGDLLGVPLPLIGRLKDVKTSGTDGGGSTANTVHVRTLNTSSGDFSKFGVLSSNQFTLDAGTYEIEASAPAYVTNRNQIYLYNVTDTSYDVDGSSEISGAAGMQTRSFLSEQITITASKTYEIRHWTQSTSATLGLGIAADNDVSNPQSNEVYTTVKITKLR